MAPGRIPARKPLFILRGEIKSPPLTIEARYGVGRLFRLLQEGVSLGMPHSRPLPSVGPSCHELRVRDGQHNWRVVYRIDGDAILVAAVFAKKGKAMQQREFDRAKYRLASHDRADAGSS